MIRLRQADLEGALAFVAEAGEADSDDAYAPSVLERLHGLIVYDAITYQEYEFRARRNRLAVGIDGAEGPFRWDEASSEPDPDGELYWTAGPCPIVHHRQRTRDLEAIRMSDVTTRRRFRELAVYRECFSRWGVDQMLDLGLPDRHGHQRSLILFRGETKDDFSERDRALLELLRPHLYNLERQAALRRRLADSLRGQEAADRDGGPYRELTPREREIVELVAEGKTNAEIAAILWVAPSTVKKHLEHVYAKLGVGRRAAVAAARYARPG